MILGGLVSAFDISRIISSLHLWGRMGLDSFDKFKSWWKVDQGRGTQDRVESKTVVLI